jgi:hypothetical protein
MTACEKKGETQAVVCKPQQMQYESSLDSDGSNGSHAVGDGSKNLLEDTSEEAFMWVLTAPLLLFKDSVLFSTESDNWIKNPTIIRRIEHK